MECRLARQEEIKALSKLSVKVGNIPFVEGQCVASLLLDEEEIVGFVAVQSSWHAAGSYVDVDHRMQRHTYEMRQLVDNELRRRGVGIYLALPGSDFEKKLFAKYGHVTEHLVQVRHL